MGQATAYPEGLLGTVQLHWSPGILTDLCVPLAYPVPCLALLLWTRPGTHWHWLA
jgi:hypothetical protein